MGRKTRKNLTPPPPPAGLLRTRWVWLLGAATVVLFQLCFAPIDLAPLAYAALVPWAVAVATGPGRTGMLVGWLTGLAAFAVGLYWLTWVTVVGYLPLIGYLSLYWLAAAWFVRRATAQRMPLWIVLPIAWTALEYARAYVISGFPWFYLAHSQYRLTALIQIADLTGTYGISFLVAMVNGLIADVILRRLARRGGRPEAAVSRRMLIVGAAAGLVLAAAMLGYGAFRLQQAERTCTPGPTITVVQSAVPISLAGRTVSEKEFFYRLYERTRRLGRPPGDLIVWPETVLPSQFDRPAGLDIGWHEVDPAAYEKTEQQWFADRARDMQKMHADLAALLADLQTPLLAGAMTVRVEAPGSEPELFNSAVMLASSDGATLDVIGIYDKIKCVPFSETVPFRYSLPWLHNLLRAFVPEAMPQLTPGRRLHRFRFGRGDTTWTAAAPICYEGVFPRAIRSLAYSRSGKQLDVLVNISNDGWFIWPVGESKRPSSELDQHLTAYVFRAIENRIPVVRAVNTGVSGFIDSSGRIGTLVTDSGLTKMVAGTATNQVLVDSRLSGYSSVGDVAAVVFSIAAAALGVHLWRRHRRATSGKE